MWQLMAEKHNILFLDFDGVLNSKRSFWKKFAEHFGVEWKEKDFDIEKWYGKGHTENMNPDLWDRIYRCIELDEYFSDNELEIIEQ
jgi:predicted adenine nucleotide alpha hydrolase (AANH) superfamily ATPase